MTNKQRVTKEGEKGHFGFHPWRWFNPDKKPSWKRFGSGTAELTVDSRKPGDGERWLSINASEHANEGASKEVMLTLDEASARSLLEFLQERFAE